jgi:hypothetical protein
MPENEPTLEAGRETDEAGGGMWRARATLYRLVIERYKDYINEREQKTIPMLKSLVNPDDTTVQALKTRFVLAVEEAKKQAAGETVVETRELGYSYENDFLDAARLAFEYAQGLGRTNSELSISFWLTFAEVVEHGVADAFDRALLLCSILESLGSNDAKVTVLGLEDGSTHPAVTFGSDRLVLLDPSNPNARFGELAGQSKAELVVGFETGDGRKAARVEYEFNRDEYLESEGEGKEFD